MSTGIVGFVPPDENWQKMKAARDACIAAGLAIPREVEEFFGSEEPDPAGQEVELTVREWSDGDMREGYELDVSAIPPHVRVVRFYNSW